MQLASSMRRHVRVFACVVLFLATLTTPLAMPSMSEAQLAPDVPQPGTKLQMATVVAGAADVTVSTRADVVRVQYFVDPTSESFENGFGGVTPAVSTAKAAVAQLDTNSLAEGVHSLAAVVDYTDGRRETKVTRFIVYRGAPALLFDPNPVDFSLVQGGRMERQINLLTSTGAAATYTLSSDVPWLTFEGATPAAPASAGRAPGGHVAEVDATGLAPGVHQATITAASEGFVPAQTTISVNVLSPSADCTPLLCSEVKVVAPYVLDFGVDHGGLPDASNIGTGFTWVDKPTVGGTGYIPQNLHVDTNAGVLRITTTGGIAFELNNNQDNTLGVGIDAADQISVLDTTLVSLPLLTGNFEQAGLWYGIDNDNYLKLTLVSETNAVRVQFMEERAGVALQQVVSGPLDVTAAGVKVQLRMRANPTDSSVTGYYSLNDGAMSELSRFTVPGALFNADGAGIDPSLGTRVFGGIYTTDRFLQGVTQFTFDNFSLTTGGNPAQPGTFGWDRKSFPASYPSSLALGPDGRLYVTETWGNLRRLTLDANKNLVTDEVIHTFTGRLVLGVTVDPASTPQNVILWVAHSDGSMIGGMFNGGPNSGVVSRLIGPGFAQEDIITGLPRALANHATNSLHFGVDGRLYIAQGGNTGAGAPNNVNTEFGSRAEQPLSAALLVADVKAAGFDGSCATPEGSFGPSPCDVQVFASGMRNMYDFAFHSNGALYGPDNGLGVDGTYPPSTSPDCTGLANPALWSAGGDNPGVQPDLLMRIAQGGYYGHPNPYRNECVFKNGSLYLDPKPAPLANYVAPILDLGMSKSANGIVEYRADAFGGLLKGDLLITNYSVGDDITRVKLTPDGTAVVLKETLVGSFNDPLPIVAGADGTLYVGEHGPVATGGKITILTPKPIGQWTAKTSLPINLLDAGSASVGGKLYVVAGKDGVGPKTGMYIYDPASNSWTVGAALPAGYPAVENPAAAELGGRLYLFGGSTAPFSGAVPNAAVYDTATMAWTNLPPMVIARGGATAQSLNGKLYVMGGLGADGASVTSVEVFDPTTGTWTAGPAMATARDNPGSASLGGKLYVFGGRTRSATGAELAPTLASVEMFDPATNAWTPRAPMPTGRRTPVVGTLDGKAQAIGGERNPNSTSGTFASNEEYDPATDSWRLLSPMPSARHGAAGGTIGSAIHVVGGSLTSGAVLSPTNVNEAFSFGPPQVVPTVHKLYLPLIHR